MKVELLQFRFGEKDISLDVGYEGVDALIFDGEFPLVICICYNA